MHYLRKYVGTYRVKADYDLDTKDFPRLENGNLDPSFDDLYIDCKNNIKIRHGVGNILSCFIPSKSRGLNILRKIYQDNISETLPKETSKTQSYCNNLVFELKEKEILTDVEVLDFEVYFAFKSSMIDYIAGIVGAKTAGKNINPFSKSNLPKEHYVIDEDDLELYKKAIENFPKSIRNMNGNTIEMVDGMYISKLNRQFDEIIIKSQPKGFEINKDRKLKGLKGKEYIHSMGKDIWDEYCKFLKDHEDRQE